MRWIVFVLALVFGLALDLGSKAWAFQVLPDEGNSRVVIDGWLSWTLAVNEGAAFGLFKGQHEFFMLVSLLAFTALPFFVHVLPKKAWPTAGLLGLVLAGVCGNFWDRMVLGHVRDFLDVHTPDSGGLHDFCVNTFGTHVWPTFNVADVFITVGLLTAVYVLGKHDDARKAAEAKAKEEAEAEGAAAAEPAKAPASETGLEAVEKAPPGFVPIEEVEDELPPELDDDSGEVADEDEDGASARGWALQVGECPFCTLGVTTKGDEWLACASCGVVHHGMCWHEEGQCAGCGHTGSLDARGVAAKQAAGGSSAPPSEAQRQGQVAAAKADAEAAAEAGEARVAAAKAKAQAEVEAKAKAAEEAKARAAGLKAEAAKAEAAKAEAAKAEAAKAEADEAEDEDEDEDELPECPFCTMPVEVVKDDDWLACGSCQSPHHDVCWHEEGLCSQCGHDESLSARSVRSS